MERTTYFDIVPGEWVGDEERKKSKSENLYFPVSVDM